MKQRPTQYDFEPDPGVPEWRVCTIKGLTQGAKSDWFTNRGCKFERDEDGTVVLEKQATGNETLHREVDIMLKKVREAWPEDLLFMFSSK